MIWQETLCDNKQVEKIIKQIGILFIYFLDLKPKNVFFYASFGTFGIDFKKANSINNLVWQFNLKICLFIFPYINCLPTSDFGTHRAMSDSVVMIASARV